MFALKKQDQGTIALSQDDYLPIIAESFLIDRMAQGLAPTTVVFCRKKLRYFLAYCEAQAATQISQLTPDLIRHYLLELAATHNEGGVHAIFRVLRTLLYWVEAEEIMPSGWRNPMRRVKAPKVSVQPIDPVSLQDVTALLSTCDRSFHGRATPPSFSAVTVTISRIAASRRTRKESACLGCSTDPGKDSGPA